MRLRHSVSESPAKRTSREPFHAVTVRTTAKSCAAAHQIAGRKYLSAEAPRLPLESCHCANCPCRYVHSADRRGRQRRMRSNERIVRRVIGDNRRGPGRRAADRPSKPEFAENYYEHIEATGRLPKPDFAR